MHPNFDLVVQPGTTAVAVDCEMVMVEGRKHGCLAWVCLVSVDNETVLLDSKVAPPGPVTDYLTRFSGLRSKDLEGAPSFDNVRSRVLQLIEGRPLVGHGIHNDLHALHLDDFPQELIVDTAELDWGAGRRKGLAFLSLELLGAPIQRGGHSPVEDALATVRLLKAHRRWGGPPPARIIPLQMWTNGRRPPIPPCCDVAHPHVDEDAGAVLDSESKPTLWQVDLEWSVESVQRLLGWWDAASQSRDEDAVTGSLVFPSSLHKEYRGILHKEARRFKLATLSRGIGEERALRVLPHGVAAPVPAMPVRRAAALAYRLTKKEAEEAFDEVREPPFSLGELEEIAEAVLSCGTPPPGTIAVCLMQVINALATLPTSADGTMQRLPYTYERILTVRGDHVGVCGSNSTGVSNAKRSMRRKHPPKGVRGSAPK